jgi:hypothetical protein
MEEVRKRLAARDWKPGADPNDVDHPVDRTVHVTEVLFRRAFEEYRASLKRPRKKKGDQDGADNSHRAGQ